MVMRYMFDLGLIEFNLAQCSSSLKCAAVMYLIRRLLRLYCQCLGEEQWSCSYRNLPPWTDSLTRLTGHKETTVLRNVAFIYGLLLIESQFFLNESSPGLMTGCGSPFRVSIISKKLPPVFLFKAAFKKFSRETCLSVATHPMLRCFTSSDIADLNQH